MHQSNGPIHVECSIMRNVMESSTEAELGGLFENYQKSTSIPTKLAEMGHPQPLNKVETYNSISNRIVNGMAKQKISRAIGIRFYWVRNQVRQHRFHILW